ncbi:MAG: ABC transporter ATP-binding protein [Desulfarculaceae bacterium]|nr:ABC transporter ATP-binding protein [Desulfarculaceae bacterium]MCF8070745.1 ABC transporter ATP-binding protein [Desulfarculaceae bacterium]MCF8102182.1 ABC transporter ATP-binding protein [Desulfarculaceae bacterium]MCF8117019.1 ABC transporter ATP-binding protein [Desulfarculaceae bacterium]
MILQVKDLHSYYGKSHVLQGVNLELTRGDLVCLLGRNGVGKSTTLMSIMGMVKPQKGSVLFDGQELVGRLPFQIAQLGLGYVPEERRIFKSLTVLENLRIGIKPPRRATSYEPWTEERVFDSFTRLAERRDNKGGHLSGGEQQMLTVARTLMGNPGLILVDEPTEGLAPLVAEAVLEMLAAISQSGVTILMVEQNYKAALKLAGSFFIMSKGRIVFQGDGQELVAAQEVRQTYLEV